VHDYAAGNLIGARRPSSSSSLLLLLLLLLLPPPLPPLLLLQRLGSSHRHPRAFHASRIYIDMYVHEFRPRCTLCGGCTCVDAAVVHERAQQCWRLSGRNGRRHAAISRQDFHQRAPAGAGGSIYDYDYELVQPYALDYEAWAG
jgi:hypothetical protein